MKNITLAVASASALLLSQQSAHGQTAPKQSVPEFKPQANPWMVDSGLLYYKEQGRVSAVKPVLGMSKDFGDERVLGLKFVVDTLSGASPNGAAPANVPQTFTGPSGSRTGSGHGDDDDEGGPTVVPARQLPKTHFQDRRAAVAASWSQPLNPDIAGNLGGNLSKERDYTSVGASLGLSLSLNQKNTTLSVGASHQSDTITPVGGTPIGLSDSSDTTRQGAQKKTVDEMIFGVTQLLSPYGFYQLSYSKAESSGYMTDPYKVLTLLDTNNQLIAKVEADTYTYLYENRPSQRTRHAIFNRIKYQLDTRVIMDISHRYTSDDWGIKSNTVDSRIRFEIAEKKYYIEPHYRIYKQSGATFYTPYLLQGGLPTYASADSRLGAFDATTIGLKVGWNVSAEQELSLAVEQYKQVASDVKSPTSGSLAGQKMQPDLNAFIAQVGYRFAWK